MFDEETVQNRLFKRIFFTVAIGLIAMAIVMTIKRAIPYSGSDKLLSSTISLDSISVIGPTVMIYDSASKTFFWLKSQSSLDMSDFDTLKSRKADIRYMKFLIGPLENRIFRMEVDSRIVIDQTVEE